MASDRSFLLSRVDQLIKRYAATYGDEITREEVARYVNGLIVDRKHGELAIFDSLPTEDLILTSAALDEEPVAEKVLDDTPSSLVASELPHPEVEDLQGLTDDCPPVIQKKPRGRPVGWRKVKE